MNTLIYIMAIASFIGLVFIAWEYVQGYSSKNWPSANGIIVQSKLMEPRNNKKEKIPLIYYKYSIKNKEYHSRRLAMYLTEIFKNEQAEEMLEAYPVGKEVVIKYHPTFHGFAVLEPGPVQPFIHLFMFVMCLLFFTVSLVAILMPGFNFLFETIMHFNG